MCSCSLFCSLPLIFILGAAGISILLPPLENFHVILTTIFMLFSRSSSFSVIHVNVDIKIKSKERIGFVFVICFFSKSLGGYAIYRRNARVLKMQNLYPAYMKG